ncbi:MAG: hypothetical protein GY855_12955 [candidate division Zixibacteria bacterium]|nr:hypothetical protein [candidate division Zixibacteria bacterium]
MYNRRVFMKISLCGAGLLIVNPFRLLTADSSAQTSPANKRFLYGNRYSGCSTPMNSPDFIPDIHAGNSLFEKQSSLEMMQYGRNC